MRELLAGQVGQPLFLGFASQVRQPGAHREEIRSVLSAITNMMALSP